MKLGCGCQQSFMHSHTWHNDCASGQQGPEVPSIVGRLWDTVGSPGEAEAATDCREHSGTHCIGCCWFWACLPLHGRLVQGCLPAPAAVQISQCVVLQAGQAAAPTEMDLATLLATFPPDVREEVLLTSEQELINSLPPALLAEAQALRDRAMRAYARCVCMFSSHCLAS